MRYLCGMLFADSIAAQASMRGCDQTACWSSQWLGHSLLSKVSNVVRGCCSNTTCGLDVRCGPQCQDGHCAVVCHPCIRSEERGLQSSGFGGDLNMHCTLRIEHAALVAVVTVCCVVACCCEFLLVQRQCQLIDLSRLTVTDSTAAAAAGMRTYLLCLVWSHLALLQSSQA